jgi:hypothetical protein
LPYQPICSSAGTHACGEGKPLFISRLSRA